MNSSILNLLIFFGSAQGFILSSILFFKKKGNRKANIIISLLILIISLDIFIKYLDISKIISEFPHLISITEPFYLLLGPLIYLYTKFQTDTNLCFKKKYLFFFLPTLLELIFYGEFYFESSEYKLSKVAELSQNLTFVEEYKFFWGIETVYNIFFIVFAIRILIKFNKKIKKYYSNIDKINFNWLRLFLILNLIFFSVQVFLAFFVKDIDIVDDIITLLYLFAGTIFMIIGYRALSQSIVPSISGNEVIINIDNSEVEENGSSKLKLENETGKYLKSSLNNEYKEEILIKLISLMEEDKKYLETSLKLNNLAEELDISSNNLSQIINEKLNKNFYDFVNSYRIEYAKEILLDKKKKHLTILAISFEVGFNSKSTFNRVFKEVTSMTPTKFRVS